MKLKKKIRIYSILAVFLVLSFVLAFPLASFAAIPATSGVNEDTTISAYYDSESFSYLNYNDMVTFLMSNGVDTSGGNLNGNLHLGGGIDSSNAEEVLNNYKFPVSVVFNGDTFMSALSAPRIWTRDTLSGNNYYNSYAVSGSGSFALVNVNGINYLVSDSEFSIFLYITGGYTGFAVPDSGVSVSTVDPSGFYIYTFNSSYGSEAVNFTNLPFYIGTLDKSTGFTDFSDFSFSGNNLNCNYPFISGDYTDPNAPVIDPDEVVNISPDGLYYVYGSVDASFSDAAAGYFLGQYSMRMNPYMLSHAEEYTFHYEHKIQILSNFGDDTFSEFGDVSVADILAGGDQIYNRSIGFRGLLNSDNKTLYEFLLNDIWQGVGQQPQYYRDDSVISYGRSSPSSVRTFGKFTLGPTEPFVPVIDGMKFYYKCYFVWHGQPETRSGVLSGWKDMLTKNNRTTENSISNNAYPPPEDLNNNYPSTSGGSPGSSSSASGGNVNVVLNYGSGLTPFTLDSVSYANVKSMFNDIKDFVDSTSENSFWAVLKKTFGYLPEQIWTYIIISVAVICGFSVARYVLRR